MPEDKSMHFYRVKRGRTLRDPRTGETLGTPGQLVPKEHRDLAPDSCLGPVEGRFEVEEAESAEVVSESTASAGSPRYFEDLEHEDDEGDEAKRSE